MRTYPLNAYTLTNKYYKEIERLSQYDKKDRGLSRSFSKLMAEISRPSVAGGHLSVDFMYELDHPKHAHISTPDWYARATELVPQLRLSEVFEYCLLADATGHLSDLFSHLAYVFTRGENAAWVLELLQLRFVQVDDTLPDQVGRHLIVPVISVVVPLGLTDMRAVLKLQFLEVLHRLSTHYLPQSCSGNLVNTWHTYDGHSRKEELLHWQLHRDVALRKFNLTKMFRLAPEALSRHYGNEDDWLVESPYRATLEATFLIPEKETA